MICLWQFFFIKRSNNFFSIKVFPDISPRNNVFNFFNNKNFFRPIASVSFTKNVFTFWYSYMSYFDILIWSPTSNLASLSLFSTIKSINVYISRLHFNGSMIRIFSKKANRKRTTLEILVNKIQPKIIKCKSFTHFNFITKPCSQDFCW